MTSCPLTVLQNFDSLLKFSHHGTYFLAVRRKVLPLTMQKSKKNTRFFALKYLSKFLSAAEELGKRLDLLDVQKKGKNIK